MGRRDDPGAPGTPDQPGWYPDPWSATGSGERYFDGKRWGGTDRGRDTVVVPFEKPRRRRLRNRAHSVRSISRARLGWMFGIVIIVVAFTLSYMQNRDSSQSAATGQAHPPAGSGES